jgi:hypothetical protein
MSAANFVFFSLAVADLRPAEFASGCACDTFASKSEGFFSVAADCAANETPSCLATLISSLGSSRPASFSRQGLPVMPHDRMPGVVVSRTAASSTHQVTGAYAFDPGFWPGSRGGLLNELPACQDESIHALARLKAAEDACSTMMPSDVNRQLRRNPTLNCRFSGLEAMVEQQEAFLNQAGSGCAMASATPNQVSLRYGFEDVAAVVFTVPEHSRIASDFAIWLRKLSGRDIGLIRMGLTSGDVASAAHPDASCECVAVAPVVCTEPSCVEAAPLLQMPELGIPDLSPPRNSFCVEHRCDARAVPTCCPRACRTRPVDLGNAQGPHWHGIFMHIPKTGGSSLECASQEWETAGLWTNMGHASHSFVASCADRCSDAPVNVSGQPSITPTLIMTVRNPYSFWWSLYGYVKAGLEGSGASGTLALLKASNATGSLATFDAFLWHMRSHGTQRAQSSHIRRICGTPCLYHFLLRTETLDADWLAVLGQLQLPLEALKHVNVVGGPAHDAAPLASHYSPELAAIVQEMEPMLFDHFGYSRAL